MNQNEIFNMERIAMNLNLEEFKGYCKGMELVYLFRLMRGKSGAKRKAARIEFFKTAPARFGHLCLSLNESDNQ